MKNETMHPLTMEEAKALKRGDILYHRGRIGSDGRPHRWKVNGKVRTWKRDPERVEIPVKRGLYAYDVVTASEFHLVSIIEGNLNGEES